MYKDTSDPKNADYQPLVTNLLAALRFKTHQIQHLTRQSTIRQQQSWVFLALPPHFLRPSKSSGFGGWLSLSGTTAKSA